MELLHVPLVIYQLAGQPVEQFGIHWRIAFASEVKDGAYHRLAHMPHPDVIDCHAGGEWISRIGNPLGQCSSTAGAGGLKWNGFVIGAGLAKPSRRPL